MTRQEYMKEYNKQYYQKNKEKKAKYDKEYYQKNKEQMLLRNKEYKNNNPANKKREIIYKWKSRGLICEDYDKLYNYYLSIYECQNCGTELNSGTGTRKCMDHCHETGQFRNILCLTCNIIRG